MSKLSLYESNWINLVFENRNKEYGAFQLRQETTKTSFRALSYGILLCTALIVLPHFLNLFKTTNITVPSATDWTKTVIQLENIYTPDKKPETAAPALPAAEQAAEAIDSKQLINPTVVKTQQATAVESYTLERSNPVENPTNGNVMSGATNGSETGVAGGTTSGNGSGLGTGTSDTNGTEIVTAVLLDKKPEFPGGIEKFYRYVGNHFNSPEMDENKNIRIFVSFVVERDGSMSNIKVLNKPGAALEKEAIRVLQSIKAKWSPGIYNSKPVRTAYNLPIVVQVN